jgi:hypothetical protein
VRRGARKSERGGATERRCGGPREVRPGGLAVHGRGENLAAEHIPSVVDDGNQMLSMPFRTVNGLPVARVPMRAMDIVGKQERC